MTNPEDVPALPSCMFARSGQDAAPWHQEVPAWLPPPEDTRPRRRSNKAPAKSRPPATYKHRDKPPQLVARRNARERRRVQAVNAAFSRLRKVVPIDNHRGKRVSKVKTLHKAIEYINQLQRLLQAVPTRDLVSSSSGRNKENSAEANNRWGLHDSNSRGPPDSLVQLLEDFEEDF